jgi:Ca2+-transporting ATPase
MSDLVVLTSSVRGRARFRVGRLRRRPALALLLQDRLGADGRVTAVSASGVTGSVLVRFDPATLEVAELRERLATALAECAKHAAAPRRAATIVPSLPSLNGTAWHTVPAVRAIGSLNQTPGVGLSSDEVARRLVASGPNRLPARPPKSALEIIWDQLGSLPTVLLGGAAVASIATGGLIDGAAILAVLALNAAIGYATESRVERILTSLAEVGIPMAIVRRDGREQVVPRADVVPGDVLLLRPGHDVPADGRLTHADRLLVDESSLTGEAVPVAKSAKALVSLEAPIADRSNMVYAGTVTAEGAGEAIVVATGRGTELGRIRALVSETRAPRTPLERHLDETGRQLALASIGLCAGLFGVGILRGLPAFGVFRTAASLAVAAVPEGLPTVATTTMALGMRRMLERRTLVRRLAAVESLGSTTVICVDKTGTVTENRMTVGRWHVAGRDHRPDTPTPGAVDPALAHALTVAALCNEATLSIDAVGVPAATGSATEVALLVGAHAAGVDAATLRAQHPVLAMSPRAEGRNWMGSMHAANGARLIAVKGAPEEVLRVSARWLGPDGEAPLDAAARRRILRVNDAMAGEGMRVLGLASRRLPADADAQWKELTWLGLVGLIDPIRPGVSDAIAVCQQAGIRPIMITGDQAMTAAAVGRQVGLGRGQPLRVLEAGELARLDADALRGVVRSVDVFARVAPAQKYEIVRALQAGGDVVAMTGDGVNDAPALKAADIGVAMGERGTDMARDIADVVLMDDDFRSIVAAVEHGRTLRANLGKALRFLLATNLAEVLVTAAATIVGRAQPLSALHLLWINLVTDVAPALALGMEPAEADVMRQAPPAPDGALLSRDALVTTGVDAVTMAATALGTFGLTLARSGDAARASTVAFSTLSSAQLLYALACRSDVRSGFTGLGDNLPLVVGIGGMLTLQAATLAVPPLRSLLRLTPLGLTDLGLVAAGAVTPLLTREALKRGGRRG